MKQVLRRGLKHMVVEELPDPSAPPHHLLVRPAFSLISSGTESASIHRDGIMREVADNPSHLRKIWEAAKANGPVRTAAEVRAKFSELAALGYSGAGYVAETHPSVTGLSVGDAVAYGGEGTGHAETIVTGRYLAARVPSGLPLDQACFATLGSIAMNAVRCAGIGLGDRVAVIGLGLVGQLVAQLARLQGAVVIAVDLKAERMEMARSLGAAFALEGGDGLRDRVRTLTGGRGVDCAIVAAAAQSSAPVRQALEICRDRGAVVVVGAVEIELPWQEAYMKEIQLRMSRAYGPGSYDPAYERQAQDYPFGYVRWTENRNMEEFLRLAASGEVRVAPLVTHRFDLADASRAYDAVLDPGAGALAVLLRYPEPRPERFEPRRRLELTNAAPAAGKVRVALAGAGNLARWAHLPALRKAGADLRSVYSTSPVRARSYASRFAAASCTTDFGDLLGDPEVDAVLLVTRNQEHARQAVAALRAGKHVFVEKPMAITEAECVAIAAAVRESGRTLSVGFNRRFAPHYRGLKRALAKRSGPAVIQCRVNSPGIAGEYWMADPAIGGAVVGEACHFVDLFYWLLESEPETVYAHSLPRDVREPIGQNNVAATFRFADGSIASLTYCTVGASSSAGERVEVFAPGLAAATEDFKRLTVHGAVARTSRKLWPDKGYDEQMADFIGALANGSRPETSVLDGARATLGCLRLLESVQTGAPRPIDLPGLLGGVSPEAARR